MFYSSILPQYTINEEDEQKTAQEAADAAEQVK